MRRPDSDRHMVCGIGLGESTAYWTLPMSAVRLRTACNKGGRTLDTLVSLGRLTLLEERTCPEFPGWNPDATLQGAIV